MSSSLPIKNKEFSIHIVHSRPNAQNEYPRFIKIYTYAQFGSLLSPGGLICSSLEVAEKRSKTVPILISDESLFRTCLCRLIRKERSAPSDDEDFFEMTSLCQKTVNELNEKEIRKLFTLVDQFLLKDYELTDTQRYTYSGAFRRWLNTYVGKYGSGFHMSAIKYNSLISEPKRSPRSLIESVHTKGLPSLEEIPHDNVVQLEQAVLQRVQTAINEIKTVCISIFDTYDNHKKQVESLLQLDIPEATKEFDLLEGRRIKSKTGIVKYKRELIKRFGEEPFLAWMAKEVQRRICAATSGVEWPTHFFSGLNPILPEEFSNSSSNAGKCYLLSPWILPSNVRIACGIILMLKTNWNNQPIRELDLEQAVKEKAIQNNCSLDEALASGVTLQGRKGKTDDDTPEYTITPGDELEMRVLTYLWGHVKNLQRIGEPVTSIFVGLGEGFQGVFGVNALPRWQKRYGTPQFTWEQLRNQSAADFHLTNRDLDALRERLGHADTKTTQGYLEQILLTRINSAINLEFQQRFETSVIFADEGNNGLLAHGLDKRHIDPNLFIPLGDGTACSDINHPQDALPGEVICGARTCHVGDGCPRNKIVMNIEQAELMLRTQRYYLNHFDELKADQSYFEAYTLPAMLFNFALVEYVKSARPDLLALAEMAMQKNSKETA